MSRLILVLAVIMVLAGCGPTKTGHYHGTVVGAVMLERNVLDHEDFKVAVCQDDGTTVTFSVSFASYAVRRSQFTGKAAPSTSL
jgi:hypothetical protein